MYTLGFDMIHLCSNYIYYKLSYVHIYTTLLNANFNVCMVPKQYKIFILVCYDSTILDEK